MMTTSAPPAGVGVHGAPLALMILAPARYNLIRHPHRRALL